MLMDDTDVRLVQAVEGWGQEPSWQTRALDVLGTKNTATKLWFIRASQQTALAEANRLLAEGRGSAGGAGGPGSTGGAGGGGPEALQAFIKQLAAAPSPSTAAADVLKFYNKHQGGTPLLYNLRPHTAQPPVPVQLLEPSFQQIMSAAWAASTQPAAVTEVDCEFARYLCVVMSAHYPDEASRCRKLQYLLERYLGPAYSIQPAKPFEQRPDMRVRSAGQPEWLMEVEVKKEMHGASGDSALQGHMYFAEYIERHQPLLQYSLCPVLLMEVVGPLLRISGMAWATVVVCQPLTPMFNLLDMHSCHPEQVLTLACTFSAVRSVLPILASRYPTQAPEVPAATWGHAPEPMPYHLHQHIQQHPQARVQRLGGNKLVYLVEDPTDMPASYVIKYTQRYGADVHRAWASKGHAPMLLGIQQLAGGWFAVVMEHLSCADGWCPVTALLPQRAAPAEPVPSALQQLGVPFVGERLLQLEQRLLNELGAAHLVPVSTSAAQEPEASPQGPRKQAATCGAHGDMRDPNILIQVPISSTAASCSTEHMELLPASSTWDVSSAKLRFIDFDWAGCVGAVRYPAFLNSSLPWPDGAAMGMAILQEHDSQLLSASIRQETRRRPPWPWEGDPDVGLR